MRAFLVPLMTAVLLLTSLAPARAASHPGVSPDEKVPIDPALVVGTLPNGLSYIIRQHKNPEGRVSIWLHVSTGSFNETESTRGLAHYLEHMAFNGTANFPPGSVIPFFQSLGLSFGRDQNAFTGLRPDHVPTRPAQRKPRERGEGHALHVRRGPAHEPASPRDRQ